MATTNWQTYALLSSSQGGKEWRVQINPEGQFRCNCPSFIFCKGIKACKHTRRCEQQRTQEQATVAVATKALALPPHVTEAIKVVGSMLTAAKTKSGLNVKAFCGPAGEQAMVDVLAAKLAAWVPPAKSVFATAAAAAVDGSGIRHITFDD